MKITKYDIGIQTGDNEQPNWFRVDTAKTEEAAVARCRKIDEELAARGLNKPYDYTRDDDENDEYDCVYVYGEHRVDCHFGAYASYRETEIETVASEEELLALRWATHMLRPPYDSSRAIAAPLAAIFAERVAHLDNLAKKLDWRE